MAEKKRTKELKHVVVGPGATTADRISAIAQIADDAPDGSAVVISTADFKRLQQASER